MSEQRLEIKIQPRSDLLLIAIKAKSLAIIVVAFPIVSRLLLSEGFSLSEEGRIEKGRDVQNRRKERKREREGTKEKQIAPVETAKRREETRKNSRVGRP